MTYRAGQGGTNPASVFKTLTLRLLTGQRNPAYNEIVLLLIVNHFYKQIRESFETKDKIIRKFTENDVKSGREYINGLIRKIKSSEQIV